MYVARLAKTNESFIVKRMPNTGSLHAPDCLSYEPAAEFSSPGNAIRSAITDDSATDETTLKLEFAMSKMAGHGTVPTADVDRDSVARSGTKFSLRGLLRYLWNEAELTRWQPEFTGKRTWSTVRKHLLRTAENRMVSGNSLASRLYVPELFSVEQRNAIGARRTAHWSRVIATPGAHQHLMLLIAEVKEIVPARYGFKAVVKHVPDQAFVLDGRLYRSLGRHFESELALWSATEDVHMVLIATFRVSAAGVPTIMELSLMPVTRQWLPVENEYENQLVERLVSDGCYFVKKWGINSCASSKPGSPHRQ